MRVIEIVPLLMITLVTSTPLEAQVLAPPIEFDCDAAPGWASTWTTGFQSPDLQVKGTIEFIQRNGLARKPPVASVLFNSDSSLQAGLLLNIDRDKSTELQAGLLNPNDPIARPVILTHPWKGNPIRFRLTKSGSGDITITIGEKSASLRVNSPELNKFSLSCSTGHVKFSDIVITPVSGDT